MTEATTPAPAVAEPPAAPTDQDRREIAILAELDDNDYGRRINEWVASTNDDGSGRRVFLSADLLQRTEAVLPGLIRTAKARAAAATNPTARAQHLKHSLTLSAVRREAGQIRDTLRRQADAERTKGSAREVAKDVLKDVFPAEYLAAVRLIEGGKTRKEATAELREVRDAARQK